MIKKEKYEVEISMNTSAKILYNRLSSPGGLAEWFADDVNLTSTGLYSFVWDGTEQKASVLSKKTDKFIRFHWIDDEDEKTYFEFKLQSDELTRDIALIITDFAEPDEIDDSIDLWESQIDELKHILGL